MKSNTLQLCYLKFELTIILKPMQSILGSFFVVIDIKYSLFLVLNNPHESIDGDCSGAIKKNCKGGYLFIMSL